MLDDYFSTEKFCTFVIPACNQDKWTKRSMEEDIQKILSGKDEIALQNNFINGLYQDMEPTE